ncbi:MAG TPA: glycosyltransferase family 39 protein [Roseiflexaceae bacterium]
MSQISQRSRARPAINEISALIGPAVLAIFVLAALPLLWRVLDRLGALLVYPYPHDGLEGTLLSEARLLWAGEPMYQPFEPHRFVSAPYPPLHPLLLGLADGIAGPHIFWGGRLLSLATALAVSMLIVLIVRRVAGSWIAGLLGAVLFLSAPPTLLWATRIKPDMLALFWTALGLYLATTDDRQKTEDRGSRMEQRRPSILDPPSSILHPQ